VWISLESTNEKIDIIGVDPVKSDNSGLSYSPIRISIESIDESNYHLLSVARLIVNKISKQIYCLMPNTPIRIRQIRKAF